MNAELRITDGVLENADRWGLMRMLRELDIRCDRRKLNNQELKALIKERLRRETNGMCAG